MSTSRPAPPDSAGARLARALTHAAFRRLWGAFWLFQLGFWLSHVALQELVADLTPDPANRARALGLLFFAMHLPTLLLMPLAGVAADRLDRRRMALLGYLGVGLIASILWGLVRSTDLSVSMILPLVMLTGVAHAWVGPATMAAVVDAVPPHELSSAVSLQAVASSSTRIVGPALAGTVLAIWSTPSAFALHVGVLAIALILLRGVALRDVARDTDPAGVLERLGTGLAHARERKPALGILATVAAMSLFGVSHVTLHLPFAAEALGNRDAFPLLNVAIGVGAVAGALAAGAQRAPASLRRAAWNMAAYGLGLVAFSASRQLWQALAIQLAVGFFYFSTVTMLQRRIQEVVDDARRGRVMSLFTMAWGGLVTLGSLGMGSLSGHLGASSAIALGGLACLSFGVLQALRSREIPSQGPGYTPGAEEGG